MPSIGFHGARDIKHPINGATQELLLLLVAFIVFNTNTLEWWLPLRNCTLYIVFYSGILVAPTNRDRLSIELLQIL